MPNEPILVILIIALSLLLIILAIKYIYLKVALKAIHQRLAYIRDKNTNLMVDSPSKHPHVVRIVNLINEYLRRTNELKQTLIREEIELRNTITNLSHDLRTPITSMVGYIQLLSKEDTLTDKQKEYLAIIESRIQTLRGLVEQLFQYSLVYEQELPEFKKEDVRLVLEEALLLFYKDFEAKGITLKLELTDEPMIREIDRLSLKRVFMNIIKNALKHGKEEVEITQTDHQIIFKNKTNGIDHIDIGKLFNRFFTLAKERQTESYGLGLTIAKLLIEKMGYHIAAELEGEYLKLIISF